MAKRDDDRILLRLTNKLHNQGLRPPCRVSIEVYNGEVTLKGIVQFLYQKRAAIVAARSMDGVQGIVDLLKVEPPVRQWDQEDEEQQQQQPTDQGPTDLEGPA